MWTLSSERVRKTTTEINPGYRYLWAFPAALGMEWLHPCRDARDGRRHVPGPAGGRVRSRRELPQLLARLPDGRGRSQSASRQRMVPARGSDSRCWESYGAVGGTSAHGLSSTSVHSGPWWVTRSPWAARFKTPSCSETAPSKRTRTTQIPDTTQNMESTKKTAGLTMSLCPGAMMVYDVLVLCASEYLYRVLQFNKCNIPEEGLNMIRYHSFYPWHSQGDYMYLCDDKDLQMRPWLNEFNKFDLYTKASELPDVEKLRPYYQSLIDKYCPGILKW
ncbi:inositol oxygenase isoform X2 [Vanacampus margaritifer]